MVLKRRTRDSISLFFDFILNNSVIWLIILNYAINVIQYPILSNYQDLGRPLLKRFKSALKQSFPYLAYVVPIILFCIDLFMFSLLSTPCLQTVAAYACVQLLYYPCIPPMLFTLLLVSMFSSIATGSFLPYLAYVVGILCFTKATSLYSSHFWIICITSTSAISIYPTMFFTYPSPQALYTIFSIIGNLATVYVSLKWFPAVKRGNRA